MISKSRRFNACAGGQPPARTGCDCPINFTSSSNVILVFIYFWMGSDHGAGHIVSTVTFPTNRFVHTYLLWQQRQRNGVAAWGCDHYWTSFYLACKFFHRKTGWMRAATQFLLWFVVCFLFFREETLTFHSFFRMQLSKWAILVMGAGISHAV